MADTIGRGGKARRIGTALAAIGFALAVAALVVLAAGPLGWRAGLVHYRIGLVYLLPGAALLAGAALLVSLAALGWWRSLGRRRIQAALGLVLGAAVLSVPFQANRLRGAGPSINDITTDTANPPAFAATLPARAAENGRPADYGPEMAEPQRRAFPDIAPVTTPLPPAEAFKRAIETAQGMSGWTIVDSDAARGRVEASERSLFYGFTDDVVIRVTANGAGSRIDVRSKSRQGRGDFGANARRVRAYLAALKQKLG